MIKKLSRGSFKIFTGSIKLIYGFTILTLLLVSCKSIPVSSPSKEADFTEHLYKLIENTETKYFSFEQIDITIYDGETRNVKAKLNILRGKFIFVNLNFLGLELYRVEITTDSIKIINRLEKTYYFDKIEGLKSIFNIELSYLQIENLILKGLFFDKRENRKQLEKRISEDTIFYNYQYKNSQNIYVKSFFNKESFQESGIEIVDKLSLFYLLATINKFNNSGTYPENINVSLKRRDYIADINIVVGKISYSKFESKPFIVNSKYREISF